MARLQLPLQPEQGDNASDQDGPAAPATGHERGPDDGRQRDDQDGLQAERHPGGSRPVVRRMASSIMSPVRSLSG